MTGKAFEEIPDQVWDIVNAAALEQWLALPPRFAADQAVVAADEVSARIAGLSPDAIEAAVSTGRHFMLDSKIHWTPHLSSIDGAIGESRSRTHNGGKRTSCDAGEDVRPG